MELLNRKEALLIADELDDRIEHYTHSLELHPGRAEEDKKWYKDRIAELEVAKQKMLEYNEINYLFHTTERKRSEILYACIALILILLTAYYFLMMENTRG